MVKLEVKQLLVLMSFASKTLEIDERTGEGMMIPNAVEAQHWHTMKQDVRQILKDFDKKFPALLPVPNDGIVWADREFED